jgi:hypothetical protein
VGKTQDELLWEIVYWTRHPAARPTRQCWHLPYNIKTVKELERRGLVRLEACTLPHPDLLRSNSDGVGYSIVELLPDADAFYMAGHLRGYSI